MTKSLVLCITFTALVCISGPARATTINWGTGDDFHVYNGCSDTCPYVFALCGAEDIATKPLVQLIGLGENGEMDDPDLTDDNFVGGDDIWLANSSLGVGCGPPGEDSEGRWSKTGSSVNANIDDLIFARAWNVTAAEVPGLSTFWGHFGDSSMLFEIETDPDTFVTGDIFICQIPEPGLLLLFAVGALLAVHRRRSTRTV